MDDTEFEGMRKMLDKKMKDLASSGIGIERRQSEVITVADEDAICEKGILGTDTPDKLSDTFNYCFWLDLNLLCVEGLNIIICDMEKIRNWN